MRARRVSEMSRPTSTPAGCARPSHGALPPSPSKQQKHRGRQGVCWQRAAAGRAKAAKRQGQSGAASRERGAFSQATTPRPWRRSPLFHTLLRPFSQATVLSHCKTMPRRTRGFQGARRGGAGRPGGRAGAGGRGGAELWGSSHQSRKTARPAPRQALPRAPPPPFAFSLFETGAAGGAARRIGRWRESWDGEAARRRELLAHARPLAAPRAAVHPPHPRPFSFQYKPPPAHTASPYPRPTSPPLCHHRPPPPQKTRLEIWTAGEPGWRLRGSEGARAARGSSKPSNS